MIQLSAQTALIVVDVQVELDDPCLGTRNNPDAEQNMARLLSYWREMDYPVYHVQHMSTDAHSTLRPDLPGNAIKAIVAPLPDEPLIQKRCSSPFSGTDFAKRLREDGIVAVVVVGLTIEHCVSSTVRAASDAGFTAVTVADATACHEKIGYDGEEYAADMVHKLALVSLQGEFCTVVQTDDLLDTSS